jgi:hypothetical protein
LLAWDHIGDAPRASDRGLGSRVRRARVRDRAWTAHQRDGQDGSGLTVDFTIDDAVPPFAVEVTRLRDDFEFWDADDVRRFKARINRQAKANGWPKDWSIGLSPETSFKADLAPAVERMLEWMVAASLDRLGPGSWSTDVPTELFQRLQSFKGRDFTKECRDARLKGVILIERLQANGILVIPVVESSDHQSLQRPIARALMEKATRSLGTAKDRGYVTMLAVDVERKDTRDYLAAGVRMWDFAPKIDHLLLFVRKIPGGDLDSAFYANRTREGGRLKRLDPSS